MRVAETLPSKVIPEDQINGRYASKTILVRQIRSEDRIGVMIATEGHPDLDTTIRDREYIEVGRRLFWEFFGELVVVHQFRMMTNLEVTRIICEDIANSHIF